MITEQFSVAFLGYLSKIERIKKLEPAQVELKNFIRTLDRPSIVEAGAAILSEANRLGLSDADVMLVYIMVQVTAEGSGHAYPKRVN